MRKRLRQVGLFTVENRKLRTEIISMYKYMKRECKEDRLFSVVPRDRTRGNEDELKHRRFCLNIRNSGNTFSL